MVKRIQNFTITETSDKVVVDYTKSLKDWFDTLLTLLFGAALSFATYFLLTVGFDGKKSFIVIGAGLIFAFQAILQSASGISRLLQPTRNLLVIDRNSKTLFSRHSPFSSKRFPLDNIQSLIISGKKDNVFIARGRQIKRTYCTISAKLKDKTETTLFSINTKRFLRPSVKTIETELYSQAKQLTFELNSFLKTNYKWTGYNEEENTRDKVQM